MSALKLASYELRRFRAPAHRLALAFLVLIPLLYGALYLWSSWDPYGHLDRVPVAVVDQDRPVTVGGTTVDAGARFVSALEADRIFDWHVTGAADAAHGLAAGRYYLVVTVPEDFSARLASGEHARPQQATVQMRRDDGNGYVFGLMARTVQTELNKRLNQAATTAYFESVYGNLDALRRGVADARDGAADLHRGLAQADDGSGRLVDGLTAAKTGSATLVDGLSTAKAGSARLAGGLSRLQSGADQLAPGAAQVAAGTRQIAALAPLAERLSSALPSVSSNASTATSAAADLTDQLARGTDTVASRARSTQTALDQLVAAHPELASDPALQAAEDAAAATTDRADQAAAGSAAVARSTAQLAAAASAMQTDLPKLQAALGSGADGIRRLADGAQQVADGTSRLAVGLRTAAGGAQALDTGNARLLAGAKRLDDGLGTAVDRLPALTPQQRKDNAQVLGDPTRVELTAAHDAKVYGRGLAPFFFSIALWVFGIAAFIVLRPITGRLLAGRTGDLTAAVASWLPLFAIGGLGGMVLLTVVWAGLGLDPVHPLWTMGLMLLGAATFTGLAHLLRLAFGTVGSALVLLLLMLQLTSSAGLYPKETLPGFFQALHPWLPMSYLVDGLRVTLTGGSTGHLVRDVLVLVGFGLAGLAGSTLVVRRRRTWTVARLHPLLEG